MSRISTLLCLLAAVLLIVNGQEAAQAQATPTYGSLDVSKSNIFISSSHFERFVFQATVPIEGKRFTVRFAPEVQTTEAVATALCTQKADEIGVTQENLSACVKGVNSYLQSVVDEWSVEKTLQVPVSIEGNRFNVRFLPEKQSATNMAEQLCKQNAELLKLTAETLVNCTSPVATYLRQAVAQWADEKTLQLPLNISGTMFDVAFMPERRSAEEMAAQLCRQHAEVLGVTEETFNNCLVPVAQRLNTAVQNWMASKTLRFNVNVDGKAYPVTILPERTTAVDVARDFCVGYAQEFGLTEATIVDKCINPVAGVVKDNIARWVAAKRLELPVKTADGQELKVVFVPERETTEAAARRFCGTQGAKLGLTNETVMQQCVAPVYQMLEKAVTNLIQQQQQAQPAQQA